MNKPLTITMTELKEKIIENINKAEIPYYCMKTLLKELIEEIDKKDEEEIQKYQESLNKKESDK